MIDYRENMLNGMPYLADTPELKRIREFTQDQIWYYNQLKPSQKQERTDVLKQCLKHIGENSKIESPFHCDYGENISIGDNFFSNYNLTVLDVALVTIGDNVLIGPNVSLYTAGHPLHYLTRRKGWEFGLPITIQDDVWIGGSVVVLPGVTIGKNSVVAAGSVVTKDVPENTIVAGNPAKIVKEITDQDKDYFYKNQPF